MLEDDQEEKKAMLAKIAELESLLGGARQAQKENFDRAELAESHLAAREELLNKLAWGKREESLLIENADLRREAREAKEERDSAENKMQMFSEVAKQAESRAAELEAQLGEERAKAKAYRADAINATDNLEGASAYAAELEAQLGEVKGDLQVVRGELHRLRDSTRPRHCDIHASHSPGCFDCRLAQRDAEIGRLRKALETISLVEPITDPDFISSIASGPVEQIRQIKAVALQALELNTISNQLRGDGVEFCGRDSKCYRAVGHTGDCWRLDVKVDEQEEKEDADYVGDSVSPETKESTE